MYTINSMYLYYLTALPLQKDVCKADQNVRDFRLPPISIWELRSSGMLLSE